MIRFGFLSAVLSIGAVQGAIVSALLVSHRANRTANLILATLIVAYVLHLVPFIIGFAGFYDAYPWLSFAPFSITLAYGPLIYLYVAALTMQRLPRGWAWNLAPAAIQCTYLAIMFVQPLPIKTAWDLNVHEPLIDPLETIATYASLGIYLFAAFSRYAKYRRWLQDATTDRDDERLVWLRNFLVIFGATVLLNLGWDVYSAAVRKLSYYAYFPLYVWFAVLVNYLALEGWRNADSSFPEPFASNAKEKPTEGDVAAADLWLQTMRSGEYYRDGELTLARLAARLAMSPSAVTRIVNAGLGQNFSEAINRLRIEAVCRALDDGVEVRSLLELAYDAGFRSKASFNRAFRAIHGMTPTEYRRRRPAAPYQDR